jgi:hypothetical protein
VSPSSVGREQIAATEALIRPHIRFTPVVEVDGRDFGLPGFTLVLKLELLQQSGLQGASPPTRSRRAAWARSSFPSPSAT